MRKNEEWARRAGRRYVARERQRILSTPWEPTDLRCRSEARRVIIPSPFIGSRSATSLISNGLPLAATSTSTWGNQAPNPNARLQSLPIGLLDDVEPDRSVLSVSPYIAVFGLGYPLDGLDVMRRQRMLFRTDHRKADVPRVREQIIIDIGRVI